MNRLLLLAIKSGSVLAVEAVVKKNFDPSATDKFGSTALHLAAKAGSLKICNILVERGCKPEAQDGDGLTCREVASLAGHTELASAFQVFSKPLTKAPEVAIPTVEVVLKPSIEPSGMEPAPEPEGQGPFTKVIERQLEIAEIDFVSLGIEDWEIDVDAVKPKDTGVSAEVWQSSRELLLPKIIHEFDATWDDVKIDLLNADTSKMSEKATVFWSKTFRNSISDWLSTGRTSLTKIEQQKYQFRDRDWPQVRRALILALGEESVLISSCDFDPWTYALAVSQAVPQRNELICDEEFLEFLHPAESADEWWEKRTSELPYLSRFDEEALINKLLRSRREIVHALSLSAPAMQIILKQIDDIFCGGVEFSSFSDADLEIVSEVEVEGASETGEIDFPSVPEPEVGLLLSCPNGTNAAIDYVGAVDRLREKFRVEETLIHDGADLQEIAFDIAKLTISPSYLRRLATQLSQECEESTLAFEIERRLNESEDSRKRLIVSHLPHAVAIAKKFEGKGLALEDLFQVAAQGVMRTLETFDPERGNRFWTLAQFWVRQTIGRTIDNESRVVRIPVHVLGRIRLISRARKDLSKGSNEPIDDAQIAEKTGLKISAVANTNEYLLRKSGEDSFPDTDSSENEAENSLSAFELKCLIENHLQVLPERQQDIIARRFGLRGFEEETLEKIGQRYGVTRERIRQLESKALDRLRHPSRERELRELLKNV